MNQTGCLQNCHLWARSELVPLLGYGNIDWKRTPDPGTGFPMFLEILVYRFSEVAVAGFLDVVAGSEEHNARKGYKKESVHKYPPKQFGRSGQIFCPAGHRL
jgi:hypothetical protein